MSNKVVHKVGSNVDGGYGTLKLHVMSKDGITISYKEQKIDSFVANHWRWMYGRLNQENLILTRAVTTTGTSGTNQNKSLVGDEGSVHRGILVSPNSDPLTVSDDKIVDRILHGNDTGTLYHNAQTQSVDTSTRSGNIQRSFVNNSGDAIVINDVAIVAANSSTGIDGFMHIRDVLTSPLTIPNDGVLVVTYDVELKRGNYPVFGHWFWHFTIGNSTPHDWVDIFGTARSGVVSFQFGTTFGVVTDLQEGGIRLGSGTAPQSWDSYALDSEIPIGTADGQLNPVSNTIGSDITVDNTAGTVSWRWTRIYENAGSVPVDINEIAVYARYSMAAVSTIYMVDRTVLESPITFNPGRVDAIHYDFLYTL